MKNLIDIIPESHKQIVPGDDGFIERQNSFGVANVALIGSYGKIPGLDSDTEREINGLTVLCRPDAVDARWGNHGALAEVISKADRSTFMRREILASSSKEEGAFGAGIFAIFCPVSIAQETDGKKIPAVFGMDAFTDRSTWANACAERGVPIFDSTTETMFGSFAIDGDSLTFTHAVDETADVDEAAPVCA